MKDFNAIFKTYAGKTKSKLGLKKNFGDKFIHGGYEEDHIWYYERMFFSKLTSLKHLHDFLKSKTFFSILEVGCSAGLLPKYMPDIFDKIEYTGVDLSSKSLEIAKKNFPTGQFIQDDFIKNTLDKSYDLVISLDVIDHVYDPDLFLEKIIEKSKKFGYLRAYRGFFENLDKHEMEYRENEGIYLNNLSLKQLEKIFKKNEIDNFQFLKGKPRDRNFYDSDLGRFWKRSSKDERNKILHHTGFTSLDFKEIPYALETSFRYIEKSKNEITAEFLGLPKSYDNKIKSDELIIIFEKTKT